MTRFVAMAPLPAMESPWPVNELPPDEEAVESTVARTTPMARASTPTLAPVTSESSIEALTVVRRSLRTTAPPTATESELVTFHAVGRGVASGTGFHQPRSV